MILELLQVMWVAGMKAQCYPEYPVILRSAERLGRPVKWVASRKSFTSDNSARDSQLTAEMALDNSGVSKVSISFNTRNGSILICKWARKPHTQYSYVSIRMLPYSFNLHSNEMCIHKHCTYWSLQGLET